MGQILHVTTHITNSGDVIFMLDGDLDIASVPVLQVHIRSLSANPGTTRAVLDLTWLRFCDATGAHALLTTQRDLLSKGMTVALIPPTTSLVRRVLHITAVSQHIPTVDVDDLTTPATPTAYAHEPAGC